MFSLGFFEGVTAQLKANAGLEWDAPMITVIGGYEAMSTTSSPKSRNPHLEQHVHRVSKKMPESSKQFLL